MRDETSSQNVESLKRQFADGKIGRREFVRFAALLGVAVPAAYALVGEAPPARAAQMPMGGTLRVANRVPDLKNAHAYSWGTYDSNISRQVVEYLTLTDDRNITHPYLLKGWQVSEDLKTWTLNLRPDVKWHNGEDFTADDVVWNLHHMLDPAVGSSVVGLVKSYLMKEQDGGTDAKGKPKKILVLWDANAIQKVDSHTVQLNLKQPQLAVPEHLFHYPATMLYPAEKGVFAPGSQGTGPFELVSAEIGRRAVVKAHRPYWGGVWNEGPYLDAIEFVDLGDDASAPISALASGQVHGMMSADPSQYDALKQLPHTKFYSVHTAGTAVLRMKVTEKPWSDPRVRKAMRLGLDTKAIMEVALRGLGQPGDHIHVAPVQPDYQPIPPMPRDVEAAKKLLADAGYPNGFQTVLYVPNDVAWVGAEAQAAAEQWKEIGVQVKLNVVPGTEYWDNWTKLPFGATTWLHRPYGLMILDLAYRSGVPWNETSYSNPEFDKLLDEADSTIDIAKRREVMGKLETIMHEDGPVAQPLWQDVFTFWNESVQGYTQHPSDYLFGARIALQRTA
jgi:peptide/nickel transport system substrate-binding protein